MGNVVSTDYYIEPIYDNEDSVAGINFCGDVYFFNKNLQGDIIEIIDAYNGKTVAKYSYDAWGKCTVDSDSINTLIAERNPFRYRGYYYDSEIGMYYLQSRYYDPNTGRFINGDIVEIATIPENILQANLFIFCCNDPINNVDVSGNLVANIVAKIILGAVFGCMVQLIADLIVYFVRRLVEGKSVSFNPSLGDYIGSCLTWALNSVNPFSGKRKILSKMFNFVPVISKYACKWISGEKINIFDLLTDLLSIIVSLVISSAISKNTTKKLNILRKNRRKFKKFEYKSKKIDIKVKGKVLGQNITMTMNFSPTLLQIIYHCIVGI